MQALASDFDGTLFFADQEGFFYDEDLAGIATFQEKGNLFGICTGRPINPILSETEGKIDFDFYVLSNGARVLDKEKNVVFQKLLPKSVVRDMYENYHSVGQMFFHSSKEIYSISGDPKGFKASVKPLENTDDLDTMDIFCCAIVLDSVEKATALCKHLEGSSSLFSVYQNAHALDIIPFGCSKGDGIQIVKEHYHIRTMAGIGDSFNDIPLLDNADVGFTFYNSDERVRSHADYLVNRLAESIAIMEQQ